MTTRDGVCPECTDDATLGLCPECGAELCEDCLKRHVCEVLE
jgi:hypothetical protein